MRSRCKVCHRYIGEPRGNDPLYETYDTVICARADGVEPGRSGASRCKRHRGKMILTLSEARALVKEIGGRYYKCPATKSHWHRTSQERKEPMHSTPHKQEACELKPWERKNADRECEHGDTKLLKDRKKAAKKARRAADKKEES